MVILGTRQRSACLTQLVTYCDLVSSLAAISARAATVRPLRSKPEISWIPQSLASFFFMALLIPLIGMSVLRSSVLCPIRIYVF